MHRIHVIDSHAGGQPPYVVITGGPDLRSGPRAVRQRVHVGGRA
jgi:proline racemase